MDSKQWLEKALTSFKLSSGSLVKLERVTGFLREFEVNDKPKMLAPAKMGKAWKDLEAHVSGLCATIAGMSIADYSIIDYMLGDAQAVYQVPVAPVSELELAPRMLHIEQMIQSLAGAIQRAQRKVGESGGTKGRKQTQPVYAGFVRMIALALDGERVTIGRGGVFEKICDTVFEVAGVHSKAEGAVRWFCNAEKQFRNTEVNPADANSTESKIVPIGRKNPAIKRPR